jgi:hypothetical protein
LCSNALKARQKAAVFSQYSNVKKTHLDASFASKQRVRQSQNTTWRFSSNITPYINRYVLII